jgi:hypothetical protein
VKTIYYVNELTKGFIVEGKDFIIIGIGKECGSRGKRVLPKEREQMEFHGRHREGSCDGKTETEDGIRI